MIWFSMFAPKESCCVSVLLYGFIVSLQSICNDLTLLSALISVLITLCINSVLNVNFNRFSHLSEVDQFLSVK